MRGRVSESLCASRTQQATDGITPHDRRLFLSFFLSMFGPAVPDGGLPASMTGSDGFRAPGDDSGPSAPLSWRTGTVRCLWYGMGVPSAPEILRKTDITAVPLLPQAGFIGSARCKSWSALR